MVAPIITFVIAGGLAFLAWQGSSVPLHMESPAAPSSAASSADMDDEPMEDVDADAEVEESEE